MSTAAASEQLAGLSPAGPASPTPSPACRRTTSAAAGPFARLTCFRGSPAPWTAGPASVARRTLCPSDLLPRLASPFAHRKHLRNHRLLAASRPLRPHVGEHIARPPPVSGSPDLPPWLASPLAHRNHLRDRRMLAAPLPFAHRRTTSMASPPR
jgi:hypothetical protein